MYDEYYDMFSAPGEVDLIIDEATDKLLNALDGSVKQIMEEASGAEKKLKDLNYKIGQKQYELKNIENRIEELNKQLENTENTEMPKKYIAKFVRDATGDFAPGDIVYKVQCEFTGPKCTACGGSKKVIAKIGEEEHEVQCPTCKGYGFTEARRHYVKKRTVNDVHLRLCFNKNRVNYWNRECVYLDNDEYCSHVSNLFRTEEEALARAEELNNNEI